MKGIALISLIGLIAIASATPAILQTAATQRADDLTAFSFADVIPSRFPLRGFNGTWVTGNAFTMRNTENNVVLYTIGNADEVSVPTTLFPMSIFETWPTMSTYTLSPDRSQILIRYDVRNIFRHSIVARYAILVISTGATTTISNGDEIQVCLWSPTGNSIAFVKENDVYFINSADGIEKRLTFDGVPGVIYNGVPDWVYEEEVFGTDYALWFSPDSSKMAIVSFDDTEVEQFTYHIYGVPGSLEDQYPEDVTLRYPKAGTTNPTVLLRVIDLLNLPADPALPVWTPIPAPVAQVGADHIIGDIVWRTNNGLLVSWLNRRQNTLRMEKCAIDTGVCEEAFSATEPNGWIDVSTPKCYDEGNRCFFLANLDGYKHVKGIEYSQLIDWTGGEYTVLSVNGYSVDAGELYFTATTIDNVHHRHVYKSSSDATPNVCLSCAVLSPEDEQCTYASAAFSADFTLYTLTCTGPGPSYTRIYRTIDQTEVESWEENLATRELLASRIMPNIQYLKVPLTGGFEATVKLMLPPQIDFTATSFDVKYPMIVNVYGGPGSDQVSDSFSIGFQHYLITSRKIIYCMIDGRGSSHSGTEQMFTVNNALGTVEIEDQITVTKYLQDNYGFIDADKTAIWGWSYGGYATAFALANDDGHVFQGGISVAPVTSWIYYDTIYTERYMGTPQDNPVGYNTGDVNQHTELLKNHEFFLIHGNADDNVHFQQAMALSRVLQQESILFEQMSYPDEAHGLNGVSNHLYLTMDKFWTECLRLDEAVSSATSLSASFLVLIVVTNILYFF